MRGEDIETFVFENCYWWTHHIYERYVQGKDCLGVVYWEGYSWGYPGIIQDWLWSIDCPLTWWEHESGMAYMKIGHKGGVPGKDFYPLEHLYPIEIGKLEE